MTEAAQANQDGENKNGSNVENANNGETSTPNGAENAPNSKFVVKRLVGQRDKLRKENEGLDSENSDLATRLIALEQENKLLKSNRLSQNEASNAPTLESCEGDVERFQAETLRYSQAQTEKLVDKKLNMLQNNMAEQNNNQAFESSVNGHYDRATKLGIANYSELEASALNILGSDLVNDIVQNVDNSEKVLAMLGENSEEAYRVKTLLEQNPVKATVELGRLSVKADDFKIESRPEPETPIEGGGQAPSVAHSNLQKQYDAALEKAAETGNNSEVRALRKQMREAGLIT